MATLTLPGHGMPRNNTERRARIERCEGEGEGRSGAARGAHAELRCVVGAGCGDGERAERVAGDDGGEAASAASFGAGCGVDCCTDSGDDSAEDDGRGADEALGADGSGGHGRDDERPPRPPRDRPGERRQGGMFGDLVVHFGARECRVAAREQRASVTMPSVAAAASVLLIGPRPRPLPTAGTVAAARRASRLRGGLVDWLGRVLLPQAMRRHEQLGSGARCAVHLTLGAPPADDATPARRRAATDSSELCAEATRTLAPALRVRRMWLPAG